MNQNQMMIALIAMAALFAAALVAVAVLMSQKMRRDRERMLHALRRAGDCDAAPDFSALSDPESQEVVRLLEQFPEVLKNALNKSEPSMVTRYSVDLAQAYNKFYYENKVMVDDPGVRAARLMLTRAAKQTIAKALELIGLDAPERM